MVATERNGIILHIKDEVDTSLIPERRDLRLNFSDNDLVTAFFILSNYIVHTPSIYEHQKLAENPLIKRLYTIINKAYQEDKAFIKSLYTVIDLEEIEKLSLAEKVRLIEILKKDIPKGL